MWIKVEEQMPEADKTVLLLFTRYGFDVSLGYWNEQEQSFFVMGGDEPEEQCSGIPEFWAEFVNPRKKKK